MKDSVASAIAEAEDKHGAARLDGAIRVAPK